MCKIMYQNAFLFPKPNCDSTQRKTLANFLLFTFTYNIKKYSDGWKTILNSNRYQPSLINIKIINPLWKLKLCNILMKIQYLYIKYRVHLFIHRCKSSYVNLHNMYIWIRFFRQFCLLISYPSKVNK